MKNLVLLFLALCSLSAQPRDYDYVRNGVKQAKIDVRNGTPRLIINNEPVPPFLFFYNARLPERIGNLDPQMRLASSNGVHIYSFHFNDWPWDDSANPNHAESTRRMELFLASDPKAVFLLRPGVWPGPGWNPPIRPSRDDDNQYADGTNEIVAVASEVYFQGFLTGFRKMVRYYENSPYATRILGYHVEGQNTGEWFPMMYRERGIDYSTANLIAFRRWLTSKYLTSEALSRAWGNSASLTNAQLPRAEAGRFPMRGKSEGAPVEFFYRPVQDQNWVDYSDYISDLIADHILQIARIVKEETGGRKLTAFFNGYIFDLEGSMNGHMKVERLLRSPDIDMIGAPISYVHRDSGDAGSSMSAVDSVALHGKLWMNEDDTNTYLGAASGWPDLGGNGNPTADLRETIGVLDRNIASTLLHRGGTWWMDLNAVGAFNHPSFWNLARTRALALFDELYAAPTPFVPDVALIVDNTSVFNEKLDADMLLSRRLLQASLRRSGAASGSYFLRDFIEGLVPVAKVYIFANVWNLTSEQVVAVRARLDAEGATAIWQLAPGYFDATSGSVSNVTRLTGFGLKQVDGYGGSTGTGLLSGSVWGWAWGQRRNVLSPRLVISDADALELGRYWADDLPSTAWKRVGRFNSVFVGDIGWNVELLRGLLKATGVHLWSEAGDVIQSDGSLLAFHTANAGNASLSVPSNLIISDLAGQPASPVKGILALGSKGKGDTSWFRLTKYAATDVRANPPSVLPWIGVVNGASFLKGASGGSWITILGRGLSTSTRIWGDSDFIGNRLPTEIDGVSVLVNGKNAYVYFVSPTQINALLPSEFQGQVVSIQVKNATGKSIPSTFQTTRFAPAFFTLEVENHRYPAATFSDGVLVGKLNLLGASVTTRPAHPGETIVLYATGLGPSSPPVPEGLVMQSPLPVTTPLTITISGQSAVIKFAGIVSPGLYQINIVIPQINSGEQPLALEVGGIRSQPGLFLTISD